MSYVITIGSEKGGVGKSTLTMCIAGELRRRGRQVLVLDMDAPQHSLARLRAAAGDALPAVMPLTGDVAEFQSDADFVLIDCPGRRSSVLRSALLQANLLLIPVAASSFEIWAVEPLRAQAEQVQRELRRPLDVRVLVNRWSSRRARLNDALDEYLAAAKLPCLRTRVRDSVGFPSSLAENRLPSGSSARTAAADVAAVTTEIERLARKGGRK